MYNPPIVSPYTFPGMKNFFFDKKKFDNNTHKSYVEARDTILALIAEEFGVDSQSIISNSRKRECTDARHVYCAVIRLKYNVTLKQIGRDLNNKDHTSVRHAILKFRERYAREDNYRYVCSKIFNTIKVSYHGERILGGMIK